MGPQRKMSNHKRSQSRVGYRNHKRALKKQAGIVVKQSDIAYPELVTPHQRRIRKINPRANITLSGKKRNKLLKQIRHSQREADQKAAEEEEAAQCTKMKKAKFRDVTMKDLEENSADILKESDDEMMEPMES